jgi:hypothetical protein
MKYKRFKFIKSWFVFPFCISFHTDLMEFYPPAKSLQIHFLWWHFRWLFLKKGE